MTDNNIYLKFLVTQSQIIRQDEIRVASGTRNFAIAQFVFTDDWDDIQATAVFIKGNTIIHIPIVDNECVIPEYMMRTDGSFSVSVYGGDLKTTSIDKSRVYVSKSGYRNESPPPAPPNTPSMSYVKSWDGVLNFLRKSDSNGLDCSADGRTWTALIGSGGTGLNGKSAYELALENGFIGTIEKWLESLKGKDGQNGHTPMKGVDYFTPDDITKIVAAVIAELPFVNTTLLARMDGERCQNIK